MIAITLLATLGPGCGSDQTMQRRVDDMGQELRDLRRSHALSSQRIREIDRLSQTTYLLQDSIEQLSLEIDQVRTQQNKLDERVKIVEAAMFEPSRGAETPQPARRKQPPPKPEPKPQVRQDDPRSLYQMAYAAMEGDDIDRAVEAFEALLKEFPRSDLADNAHYWLGEMFIELGNTEAAATHFESILKQYPGGNKVPDAMYKLGVLAEDQGDVKTADTWYRKVIEQFPWSPVAEKAGARQDRRAPNN